MLAHVEEKYGRRAGYPVIIMTDGELPDQRVRDATARVTNGKAIWILIDETVGWGVPPWINLDVLNLGVPEEYRHHFPVGYHSMCRFYGGFAYSHPILRGFDYFWRLDSNVRFHCVPPYDPAQWMIERDLDYGARPCVRATESAGFIHAEPDSEPTLEGFGDMLNRFVSVPAHEALIHPRSNWRRWLLDAQGQYTRAAVCASVQRGAG